MIAVSMCLLGVKCAYSGSHNQNQKVIDLFCRGKAFPICPEQLAGLTTPRYPSEIKNGRVVNQIGEDVTDAFYFGANEAVKLIRLAGCSLAILKARSPACGCGEIYDGTFSGRTVPGDGVLTGLLKRNAIEVFTEDSFDYDRLRQ